MNPAPRASAIFVFVLALLLVMLSSPLARTVETHATPTVNYPTSYGLSVSVLDFREADHSANISISFSAELGNHSGPPGRYGLDLVNTHISQFGNHHEEKNGTCIDQACAGAFWNFFFFVRFAAFGVTDFYPYDSWMFNLTLTTPLLFAANKTNTEIDVTPSYAPGWEIKGAPTHRLVDGQGFWNEIVVTMILQRASWSVTPIRTIPLVLFLILGLTALIPAKDLSSKVTVVMAIIFFITASIFSLETSLPPRVYGLSFAETVFYYLLLLAAVFLGEAIIENRVFGRLTRLAEHHDLRYLFLMQIGPVAITVFWIWIYTNSYATLASTYWWSAIDPVETRYIPIFFVALGSLLNIVISNTSSYQLPQSPQSVTSTNDTQQLVAPLAVIAAVIIGTAFLYNMLRRQPKVTKAKRIGSDTKSTFRE